MKKLSIEIFIPNDDIVILHKKFDNPHDLGFDEAMDLTIEEFVALKLGFGYDRAKSFHRPEWKIEELEKVN